MSAEQHNRCLLSASAGCHCITQLLSTAGFCSVLGFYKAVPEFPVTISELKNPSPLTRYLYSANRIKNLSFLIFYGPKNHTPLSYIFHLLSFCVSPPFRPTEDISLPIFSFSCFHRCEKAIRSSAKVFPKSVH